MNFESMPNPIFVKTEPVMEPFFLQPTLVDPKLIPILESRYTEAQLCIEYSPLSTIMLCGSLLEGILLGIALKSPRDFNCASSSPKDKDGKVKLFRDWSLAQLIDVAYELGLLTLDVKKYSHFLRDFRNYIHPNQQLIEKFNPTKNTAALCFVTLKSAIDSLNKYSAKTKQQIQQKNIINWNQHPDATYLIKATLIGSWQNKSQYDHKAINHLLGIDYEVWINKAREIMCCSDSPLTVINGTWNVVNRAYLWNLMGSRILDQDLDNFKFLAISVLRETDPIFELPIEEWSIKSIHSREIKYSPVLRNGIAEGLAILGTQPEVCVNCSKKKAETICKSVVHELLIGTDFASWNSLNRLLPILAEAAPNEFLKMVENVLKAIPCPFDVLLSQEENSITSYSHLTGLLWALEGLAWDQQHFIRVCVILAELASYSCGNYSNNRPFDSLVTILLPWMPQTLASSDKQKVAMKTLFQEQPDIAWKLFFQLLPSLHQTSLGTYKPKWRKIIPDDWEPKVNSDEYIQQVSCYEKMALNLAFQDTSRLFELIDHLDNLQQSTSQLLLQTLVSQPILAMPEEQLAPIFFSLKKLINKHRRFPDAKWALSNEWINRIEHISEQLAPTTPFILYQYLFTGCDIELLNNNADWEYQRKELDTRREMAICEIYKRGGVNEVIQFAESVSSPREVGYALGVIEDPVIENSLLPSFLISLDKKHIALVSGFIWKRYLINDWKWCDSFKTSNWTPEQTGQFLACLPFTKTTWDRASTWLQKNESQYWRRANVIFSSDEDDLTMAIDKLIFHGRPEEAINCLNRIRTSQPIDCQQCIRALLSAASSLKNSNSINKYNCIELIKFLQTESSVNQNDLLKVEWEYIPWLDGDWGAIPRLHYNELANDPEMFCEMIQYISYLLKNDQSLSSFTEETESFAINAWRLLQRWNTPPGTQQDGSFSDDVFNKWLQCVQEISTKSGYLDVALTKVGEVLIYAPADLDGLWIHRSVATVLNARDADIMRSGYIIGINNLHNGHWVDPTGKPEKDLAEQYRNKADAVENAGFPRFAVTLRKIADDYDNEADQIISGFELHQLL